MSIKYAGAFGRSLEGGAGYNHGYESPLFFFKSNQEAAYTEQRPRLRVLRNGNNKAVET